MSKVTFEQNGETFDVSGDMSGTMPEILDFSTKVLFEQISHTYTAVSGMRGIRDSMKREEMALFATIQVVKDAFDSFMEEHDGALDGALDMLAGFEKFKAEMEG